MSCLHIVVLATVLVSQGMASTISDRACQAPFDKFPFCDTTLSIDARVDDLVSRIHNEEKGPLMTARGDPRGNLFNLTRIGGETICDPSALIVDIANMSLALSLSVSNSLCSPCA